MADSILRLKVESQEYDQKIKRAAEGLRRYVDVCHQQGDVIGRLLGDTRKYVESIGQMDTVATNAKGQMRELSDALTTFTQVYRGLSDEEKNAPFGQELSKQIGILTERAGQVKDAMGDVEQSIRNAASDTRTFDQLAQGASVVTAGFQGLTGVGKLLGIEMGDNVEIIAKLQAAMAVTNSLTTIQNALQEQSALMQGVMAAKAGLAAAAQKAVALATGDATKAQAAYNAVANANPYVLLTTTIMGLVGAMTLFSSSADENAEKANNATTAIENMTTAAQNYIDIMRQLGASQDTLLTMGVDSAKSIYDAAVAQRQSIEKQIRDAMDSMDLTSVSALGKQLENARQAERNAQVNYGKALDARRSQALFNQELMKRWDSLNTDAEIDAAIQAFTKLRRETERGSAAWKMYDDRITKLQDKLPKTVKTTTKGGGGNGHTTEHELSAQQKIQKQINDLIEEAYTASDDRRKNIAVEVQGLQKQLDIYKNIKDEVMGIKKEGPKTVTGTSITSMSGMSSYISMLQDDLKKIDFGKEGADAIYKSISQSLADTTMLQNLVSESLKLGLGTAMFNVADETGKDFWTRAMEGGIENVDWQAIVDKINEKRKEMGLDALIPDYATGTTSSGKGNNKTEKKDSEKLAAIADDISKYTGDVSNITSGLQSLGVEIPKGLQDVVSGIQGVASILTGISAIVSVIEALTAVKSIPVVGTLAAHGAVIGNAAGGMIIPGNSFSGDRLRMPVAGGGMIGVNSGEVVLNRAQTNNLASALEGGGQQIAMQPYVDGEKIFLGMNNTSKRMGRGEIVTTGMLRRLGLM